MYFNFFSLLLIEDFIINEHKAGDKDNAIIAEKPIETAIQTANCLYINPESPGTKATGTKTAIKTIAIATSAPPTSFIVICEAILGSFPSSICLCTFSITTIASSTTVPTARTKANKVNVLIDISKTGNALNVPIKETGIATSGIIVALIEPKKIYVIKITINEASKIVLITSFIDSMTKSVSSLKISSFKPSGKPF